MHATKRCSALPSALKAPWQLFLQLLRPLRTQRYADPFAWDLPAMRAMLGAFLNATGATSIPPLEEYTPSCRTRCFCDPCTMTT